MISRVKQNEVRGGNLKKWYLANEDQESKLPLDDRKFYLFREFNFLFSTKVFNLIHEVNSQAEQHPLGDRKLE